MDEGEKTFFVFETLSLINLYIYIIPQPNISLNVG